MDISDGDLFSVFGEEWVTVNLTEPENRPENDGRVGEYIEGDGFFSPREPPEWREPFENILTAFGSPPPSPQGPPPSPQGPPPSPQGPPPSRHGYPPAQPEQPTTARFPAPSRTVAIQHCRRLSVYPFLPEWPGQAAANSDRLYGRISSRDMVSREGGEKKKKKKGGGEVPMYAFVCPSGMNCENFSHFQAFLAISQRNETF